MSVPQEDIDLLNDNSIDKRPIVRQLLIEAAEAYADKMTGGVFDMRVLDKEGKLELESTKRVYDFLFESDFQREWWLLERKKFLRGFHAGVIDIYNKEPRFATGTIVLRPSKLYGADIFNVGILKESYVLHGAKLRFHENYSKKQPVDKYGIASGDPTITRTRSVVFSENGIDGKPITNEKIAKAKVKQLESIQVAQQGAPSGFIFPDGWLSDFVYDKGLQKLPVWEFTIKGNRRRPWVGLEPYFDKLEKEFQTFKSELLRNRTKYIFPTDQIPNGKLKRATQIQKTMLENDDIWFVSTLRNFSGSTNSGLPWEIFKGDPKLEIYWSNLVKTRNFILNVLGQLDSSSVSGGVHNKTRDEVSGSKERNHHILESQVRLNQEDWRRMIRNLIEVDRVGIVGVNNEDKYPEGYEVAVTITPVDTTNSKEESGMVIEQVQNGLLTRAQGIQVLRKMPSYLAVKEVAEIDAEIIRQWEELGISFQGYSGGINTKVEGEDEKGTKEGSIVPKQSTGTSDPSKTITSNLRK